MHVLKTGPSPEALPGVLGSLDSNAGTRLVKNVLPNPGVFWVLGKDVVADIYGIHKPSGLHVVEGKLITCRGNKGMGDYTCLPEDC